MNPLESTFRMMLIASSLCAAQAATPATTLPDNPVFKERNETPEQHAARMAWWREAKFGMFIHWGLYAQAGGEWMKANGEAIYGSSASPFSHSLPWGWVTSKDTEIHRDGHSDAGSGWRRQPQF